MSEKVLSHSEKTQTLLNNFKINSKVNFALLKVLKFTHSEFLQQMGKRLHD